MLKKEQFYRIMELLNRQTFVSVSELTQQLGISRSSVMRDLAELESQGLIKRERGGAASMQMPELALSGYSESPVASRRQTQAAQKDIIARTAAKKIRSGSCIFLDGGTTPAYLLPYLQNKKVQIVTPSTYLLSKIPSGFAGEIYLLGGSYLAEYETVDGPISLDIIRRFNFDCAFLGTNGIDAKSGACSIFSVSIGAMKAEVLKHARRSCLLADSSKFRVQAVSNWASLNAFDEVYTDAFPAGVRRPANVTVCAEAHKEKKNR